MSSASASGSTETSAGDGSWTLSRVVASADVAAAGRPRRDFLGVAILRLGVGGAFCGEAERRVRRREVVVSDGGASVVASVDDETEEETLK